MGLETNSIVTNMLAMNSSRQMNIVTDRKAKSTEKLSSGYRINRAADDAAGLAISEKMRRQIRGLNQGTRNLQDGVSFCQVADGALNEVHDMLLRMEELAVKAANGTMSDDDRSLVNDEVSQLLDSMEDIFSNTQFNEKYIWRVPYAPRVSGNPNDIQIYNSPTGVPAGVLIENVRFTWDELGFGFNPDGTFTDNEVDISGRIPSGKPCVLMTVNGAQRNDVGRVYSWSADDAGIHINGELVKTWPDLCDENGNYSGTYSMEYHGMTISYDSEADDRESVINGINGEGLNDVSWRSAIPTAKSYLAVRMGSVIENGKQPFGSSVSVTNSNIADIHDNSDPGYRIRADQNKIWVEDMLTGETVGEKAWSDFADINTGEYPFSDWGRPGDHGDSITMSSAADYQYGFTLKNGSQFTLPFQVLDEVSQQAVIDTFNNVVISTRNENTGVYTKTSAEHPEKATASFHLTNDKINEWKGYLFTSPVNTAFRIETVVDGEGNESYVTSGNVSFNVGGTYFRGAFSADASDDTVDVTLYENGDPDADNSITLSGFHYGLSNQRAEFRVSSDGNASGAVKRLDFSATAYLDFEYQKANGRNFNSTDDIFNTANTPITINRNSDGSGTVSLQVGGGSFVGSFSPRGEDAQISVTLYENGDTSSANRIRLDNFDLSNNQQKLNIKGYQVTQKLNGGLNALGDLSTTFGVIMNPVMKKMDLQASGKVDDVIRIRWHALTCSTIGMGGANVSSVSGANETINAVKYAQSFISGERIRFGAAQNRVEHAMSNNRNTAENTQAAESLIRDTDMAKEMVAYSKENILQQAGQTMLAQANQNRQGILQLLQ